LPTESIELLAGPVTREQSELLTAYGDAIVESSRRVNLVSRKSLVAIDEHFVDAAALLSFTNLGGGDLGDLGSGAGFPGVVVAVLRPGVSVTLIDSRRSKVVFLKDVTRRLRLENVTVVHGRLEDLAGQHGFGLAVARALGSTEKVLAPCLRMVAPGGRLVLFKGPRWSEEASLASRIASEEGARIVRTESISLPRLSRATTFVEFHVEHVQGG